MSEFEMIYVGKHLICDEMLIGLARWLRAAGYDTELLAPGVSDRDLMNHARANDQVILTRDRKFLERRGANSQVLLVTSNSIEEQVREITGPLGIDWLMAPFSRCTIDNALVRSANKEEIANMPGSGQGLTGPFMSCPNCGRLYWSGSHTQRMHGKLETWSQGLFNERTVDG